jgi:hypothetical protein
MATLPPQTFILPRVEMGAEWTALDRVVEQIVNALLERELVASGHKARLTHYGGSVGHFVFVSAVEGPGYELELLRPQGTIAAGDEQVERRGGLSRVKLAGFDVRFYADSPHAGIDAHTLAHLEQWMRVNVLEQIQNSPAVPGAREGLINAPAAPYPAALGPLVTLCDRGTAQVIVRARRNGLHIVRRDQMPTMRCAFDAAVGPVARLYDVDIPGTRPGPYDTEILKVFPLWANGIWVRDAAAFERMIRSRNASLALGTVGAALAQMSATEVPLQYYTGGFERPLVLLRRHVVPEELLPLGGSWPPVEALRQQGARSIVDDMRQHSPAAFKRALIAFRAHMVIESPSEAMWTEVVQAIDGLTAALGSCTSLTDAFIAFYFTHDSYGEPLEVRQFVAEYIRRAVTSAMLAEA